MKYWAYKQWAPNKHILYTVTLVCFVQKKEKPVKLLKTVKTSDIFYSRHNLIYSIYLTILWELQVNNKQTEQQRFCAPTSGWLPSHWK